MSDPNVFALSQEAINSGSAEELAKVNAYLEKFGYMELGEVDGQGDNGLLASTHDAAPPAAAVRAFQAAAHLPETGVLDPGTVAAMEMPRCGNPDTKPSEADVVADFALRGCSYQDRSFGYVFDNDCPGMSADDARGAIQRAFMTWSNVVALDFNAVAAGANPRFSIGWYSGDHNDGSAFDGVGTVLAHAFYPPPCGGPHAGKCHFDSADQWGLDTSNNRRDLETVALHEFGHLLGLAHSDVAGSVMEAFYGGPRRALSADDIAGIRALYGDRLRLTSLVHLQNIGDVVRSDNQFNGTRGQSRRLEGFQLNMIDRIPGLSCRYMAHLQDIGDTGWVDEGQFVGTRGQSRRLEGFAIELTGPAAANYKVRYMAHLQDIGDTPFVENGQFCGTRGQSRRVEGILVHIEQI